MSDQYVQSASNTGTTTAAVTLTGVVAGNALVAFCFNGSTTSPVSHSVADGQGSYTAQGPVVTDTPNTNWSQAFVLLSANSGSHTATFTSDSGTGVRICLIEVGTTAGASAFSGANGAKQSAPAAGANTLNSGTVTITGAATLIGFSGDTSSTATSDEPTAGTSPNAFTSRNANADAIAGAWRLMSAALSSDAAITAGPVTNSHEFITLGVAILNAASNSVDDEPGWQTPNPSLNPPTVSLWG